MEVYSKQVSRVFIDRQKEKPCTRVAGGRSPGVVQGCYWVAGRSYLTRGIRWVAVLLS